MVHYDGQQGLVFVLVGPSGVGKNTLMKRVIKEVQNLRQLATATTREIRDDEQEGREHFFKDKPEFDQLVETDALLEWQWVHDRRYGIIRSVIEDAIHSGDDLIADIEVLGAALLQHAYPHNAVLIFVSPPGFETLEERIRARGTDSEAVIARRLQRVMFEMKYATRCDYLVVNENLDQATRELQSIIFAERSKRSARVTTVSAIIQDGAMVLVDEATNALPYSSLYPGERPEEAAYRVTKQLGIGKVLIERQPAAPEDGIGPAHFTVECAADDAQLNLIFRCRTTEPVKALKSGWVWKPIEEAVPLIPQDQQAQLQER